VQEIEKGGVRELSKILPAVVREISKPRAPVFVALIWTLP
jgi:hypothetical protein